MAKQKKTSGKGSWKVTAGLLAFLALMALGSSSSKKEVPEEPVRSVVTAEPAPAKAPTPSPEPTPTPYRIHGYLADATVYVSNSGIIHFDSGCSGMKHYTEMTLEEADAAGYEICGKCG